MDKHLMHLMHLMGTPSAGVAAHVAEQRSTTAPIRAEQGTALSVAGSSAAVAGVRIRNAAAHTAPVAFGARSTDLPGLVARGAPV